MPYVDASARYHLDGGGIATTGGELCYQLTLLVLGKHDPVETRRLARTAFNDYVSEKDPKWQNFCDVMGAVMGAIAEIKRRGKLIEHAVQAKALADELGLYYNEVVGPYEDGAIARNGDIAALAR